MQLLNKKTQLNIYSIKIFQESCTINIDTTDSSVFYENATGAIAVTVQDYARKLLKLKEEENLIHPYEQVLSAVTVQVSNDFNVTCLLFIIRQVVSIHH